MHMIQNFNISNSTSIIKWKEMKTKAITLIYDNKRISFLEKKYYFIVSLSNSKQEKFIWQNCNKMKKM